MICTRFKNCDKNTVCFTEVFTGPKYSPEVVYIYWKHPVCTLNGTKRFHFTGCPAARKPEDLGNVKEFENGPKKSGNFEKREKVREKLGNFLKLFDCRPSSLHTDDFQTLSNARTLTKLK